ncbi:hypothetical protein AAHA92_00890 [Salvia divinorum]|uniref:Uncharacterized protein n=1 Tax=Salvia divinorum TaxID=28513 RepID=A0ABD1IL35_SALDI
MDMLAKQLSQIATSISKMRGNDGKISATVKMSGKENISQITLRSGKAYEGPPMRAENGEPSMEEGEPEVVTEEKEEKEEKEKEKKDASPESSGSGVQQTKPFLYR